MRVLLLFLFLSGGTIFDLWLRALTQTCHALHVLSNHVSNVNVFLVHDVLSPDLNVFGFSPLFLPPIPVTFRILNFSECVAMLWSFFSAFFLTRMCLNQIWVIIIIHVVIRAELRTAIVTIWLLFFLYNSPFMFCVIYESRCATEYSLLAGKCVYDGEEKMY